MVHLFAISIDDVRDMFGAHAALAEELRAAARSAFEPPAPKRHAFRPLLKPEAVDPARPTSADLEALLRGGYIKPERMPASWELFRILLTHRAQHTQVVQLAARQVDDVEFDLARAELDAHYALRRLAIRELGIPLKPPSGGLTGYAKHAHVAETAEALREVLPRVEPSTARLVEALMPVLETTSSDPRLDLVVVADS